MVCNRWGENFAGFCAYSWRKFIVLLVKDFFVVFLKREQVKKEQERKKKLVSSFNDRAKNNGFYQDKIWEMETCVLINIYISMIILFASSISTTPVNYNAFFFINFCHSHCRRIKNNIFNWTGKLLNYHLLFLPESSTGKSTEKKQDIKT